MRLAPGWPRNQRRSSRPSVGILTPLRSSTRSQNAPNQIRTETSYQGRCKQSSPGKMRLFGATVYASKVRGLPGSPEPPHSRLQQEAAGWGSQTARTAQHTQEINKLHRYSVPLGSSLSLHIIVSLCMSPCNTGLFIIAECLDWPC